MGQKVIYIKATHKDQSGVKGVIELSKNTVVSNEEFQAMLAEDRSKSKKKKRKIIVVRKR